MHLSSPLPGARPHRALTPALAVAVLSAAVGGLLPHAPTPQDPTAPAPEHTGRTAADTTSRTGAADAPAEAAEVRGESTRQIALSGVDEDALGDDALAGLDADQRKRLAVLSAPVTDAPFTVVAAAWAAGSGESIETVQVRLRQDGAWTGWQELERTVWTEDVPAERTGTDPLVAFGATGAQVRVVTADGAAPAGFELSLIDPGTAATDEAVASQPTPTLDEVAETAALPHGVKAAARPGAGQDGTGAPSSSVPQATMAASAADARAKILPDLITRAQWGADESWARDSTQFSTVTALTIHHTAGTNGYTRAQAVEQMRGIYAYYTKTLKWGDFPYHLITDRFGNIYEGRRGALTSNPLGTHAGGFNTGTMGISTLGNYDVVAPSQETVDAMARAAAFYVYRDGLDAHGTVTLTTGGTNMWPAGSRVTLDTIFPHRATKYTACPGQYLMPRLDEIRDGAARIAAAAEGTTTPAPAPSPVPYTGDAYTVQPGDGWWIIAQRTGVSMPELQRLNGMTAGTVLHPGMVLKTTTATSAPAPVSGGTYTVQPGDGWWTIAQRTGVSMTELQRLNGMTASTELHPGMVLRTSSAVSSADTYTVQPNDGWWIIAQRTGVSMAELQRLNGMTAGTVLHPG
ncbi:LysM peptidoglycan-binding domain-containing protein, partial [Micrococcus sp.]|uniref:LysM peptidoglycan-binding domain-containing protein n=1 Tax=Micrococcus sp. TaxID=1271 RepID=UPI0026DD6611